MIAILPFRNGKSPQYGKNGEIPGFELLPPLTPPYLRRLGQLGDIAVSRNGNVPIWQSQSQAKFQSKEMAIWQYQSENGVQRKETAICLYGNLRLCVLEL